MSTPVKTALPSLMVILRFNAFWQMTSTTMQLITEMATSAGARQPNRTVDKMRIGIRQMTTVHMILGTDSFFLMCGEMDTVNELIPNV